MISEWQRQSTELEEQLTQLQGQLDRSNKALAARDATIESLNSQHTKAWQDDIERLRGELDDEKKRTIEAKEEVDALCHTLEELKTESTDCSKNLQGKFVHVCFG